MPRDGILHEDQTESDSDIPLLEEEKKPLYTDGLGQDIYSSYKSINNDDDKDLLRKDQAPSKSICKTFLTIVSAIAVETLMFAFMFCWMLRSTVITNMIMDKACRFRFNYSDEVCSNLSNHTEEKTEVEKLATNFSMYINLLHFAPAAVVMMFIGPWSDKYGRKPPLIIAIVGRLLDDAGTIINTYFFEAKIEYLLLSSVPSGITGGFICFLAIIFSLVSELNSKNRRTVRFAFAEMALGLGMTCGSLVGGLIYDYFKSYMVVYCTTAAGHVMCGIWVILVITETKGLNSDSNWRQILCDVFSLERAVEGFKVCLKVRENRGRAKIWLILGSMCVIVLTYESFASIGFTYVHHRYNWGPTTYGYVNSISSGVGIAIMVICVPLFIRVCKMRDTTFGIIGILSSIVKNVCIGLASKPWMFVMGNILGVLFATAILSARSMLSKLVPEDELGKAFSFMSICEALVPLAGTVIMTKIFNATISFLPGLCYLIASVLLVIPLGAFTWMATLKPNGPQIPKQNDDFPSATEKNAQLP